MLPYTSKKSSSWEVKARGHVCSETGEGFEEGEKIISRLINYPSGMVREDYKREVWNKDKQEGALFYWKTQYRKPPPKKESAFKEENAEETLRQLVEEKHESTINTVFILAVMLERKRIFIERGVQRDAEGRQIRIYEHKESGETFLIPDPELTLEQITEVQQEVALELGWIKPEEPQENEGVNQTSSDADSVEKLNVLFLCTGNSCRSQMAEGWARALKSDHLTVYSAGVEAHGLNSSAIKVMLEAGIDIQGHTSKSIDDFRETPLDVVVTVCDHAHETCPWFPQDCKVVHAGFDDPPRLAKALAEQGASEEEQLDEYRRVRDTIKEFVEAMPENLI